MMDSIEGVNFIRVSRAISFLFTAILRVQLMRLLTPAQLKERLYEPHHAKKVRPDQKQKLKKLSLETYDEFDISLLYLSLRHFCDLTPPAGGWGLTHSTSTLILPLCKLKYPCLTDINIADDIERIHIIRNDLWHAPNQILTQDEFSFLWDEMTNICRRMQREHDNDSYLGILNHLAQAPLNCLESERDRQIIAVCKDIQDIAEMFRARSRDDSDLKKEGEIERDEFSRHRRDLERPRGDLRKSDLDIPSSKIEGLRKMSISQKNKFYNEEENTSHSEQQVADEVAAVSDHSVASQNSDSVEEDNEDVNTGHSEPKGEEMAAVPDDMVSLNDNDNVKEDNEDVNTGHSEPKGEEMAAVPDDMVSLNDNDNIKEDNEDVNTGHSEQKGEEMAAVPDDMVSLNDNDNIKEDNEDVNTGHSEQKGEEMAAVPDDMVSLNDNDNVKEDNEDVNTGHSEPKGEEMAAVPDDMVSLNDNDNVKEDNEDVNTGDSEPKGEEMAAVPDDMVSLNDNDNVKEDNEDVNTGDSEPKGEEMAAVPDDMVSLNDNDNVKEGKRRSARDPVLKPQLIFHNKSQTTSKALPPFADARARCPGNGKFRESSYEKVNAGPRRRKKGKHRLSKRKTINEKRPSSTYPQEQSTDNALHTRFHIKWKVHVPIAAVVVLCAVFWSVYLLSIQDNNEKKQEAKSPKIKPLLRNVDEYLWGTYVPPLYFGFTSRKKDSPVIALMWQDSKKWHAYCDKGIQEYGWLKHDGESFGIQRIRSKKIILHTQFLRLREREGYAWEIRITSKNMIKGAIRPHQLLLQIFGLNSDISIKEKKTKTRLDFVFTSKDLRKTYIRTKSNRETEFDHGRIYAENTIVSFPNFKTSKNKALARNISNGVFARYTSSDEIDVSFRISHSSHSEPLNEDDFSELIEKKSVDFDNKVNLVFGLSDKNYSADVKYLAGVALSQVLGGIGYFHGSIDAQDVISDEIYNFTSDPLYASTPSRESLAHGFLWDEGFHNMLIVKWNYNISLDILGHWLDLMDGRGWIPREQILDDYSRSTIDKRYIVQKNNIANPPTFLFPLLSIARKLVEHNEIGLLQNIYDRTVLWFKWFENSQLGSKSLSYRWRGRDDRRNKYQRNKDTMASGLDDYPRALYPDAEERHLDLRCWVTVAAGIISNLSSLINNGTITEYQEFYTKLIDEKLLNEMHWDDSNDVFGDYGNSSSHFLNPEPPSYRIMNHVGYISIFPFMLKLIHPDSYQIQYILSDITEKLWTAYGLRSLAKKDPYYQQRNEEEDDPQWRGDIRLNINYFVLGALKYYSRASKTYRRNFADLYEALRANILKNVIEVYQTEGQFFEKYDDETGIGKGHYPSTGTASAFLLILSETYY